MSLSRVDALKLTICSRVDRIRKPSEKTNVSKFDINTIEGEHRLTTLRIKAYAIFLKITPTLAAAAGRLAAPVASSLTPPLPQITPNLTHSPRLTHVCDKGSMAVSFREGGDAPHHG